MRVVVLAATLAMCVFASGCSDDSSANGSTGGAVRRSFSWSELPVVGLGFRSPFDVVVTQVQKDEDDRTAGIKQCLDERGFSDLQGGSDGYLQVVDNLFRPNSRSDAERNGLGRVKFYSYQLEQFDSQTESQADSPAPATASGEDTVAAINACSKQSSPATASAAQAKELADTYVADVLSAAPIEAARSAWASCMGDRGFAGVRTGRDAVNVVAAQVVFGDLVAATADVRAAKLAHIKEMEVPVALAVHTCDESAYGPALDGWSTLERRWQSDHADEWSQLTERDRLLFAATLNI